MVKDIVPELLELLETDFDKKTLKSEVIIESVKRLRSEQATYKDVNNFAIELGDILSETFKTNIIADILPDNRMYYNIADRLITPTMTKNHELIAGYAQDVQTLLNHQAGLGIRGQIAPLNQSRVKGIVERLSSEPDYNKIKWILDEPVKNFSQSIVDDTIKKNVEFHAKAGLGPKIVRRSAGNCCDWCNEIVGTYDYAEAPKDIYRRHRFCRCTVEYDPGDGRRQNVHTKKWIDPEKNAKIEKRKLLGLGSGSIGDAKTQKPKLIQKVLPEDIEKNVKRLENEIRGLLNEHAIIALPDGSLYRAAGDSKSVSFKGLDLKGATITHNHPIDKFGFSDSFGKDDFEFLKSTPELDKLRAVNEKYNYEVRVLKPLEISYNEAYRNSLDITVSEDEIQHNVMKWLQEEGYVEYKRDAVNRNR